MLTEVKTFSAPHLLTTEKPGGEQEAREETTGWLIAPDKRDIRPPVASYSAAKAARKKEKGETGGSICIPKSLLYVLKWWKWLNSSLLMGCRE